MNANVRTRASVRVSVSGVCVSEDKDVGNIGVTVTSKTSRVFKR